MLEGAADAEKEDQTLSSSFSGCAQPPLGTLDLKNHCGLQGLERQVSGIPGFLQPGPGERWKVP